ncbi:MAG: Rieske 2Fe-2S domain-containing protein [Alphaproteobacteria bacterium]
MKLLRGAGTDSPVLSESDARDLVATSAGTPVGELLRRYWMPVAGVSELDERPVLPVRLLGEDLVLYRDRGGRVGLVDRWCPHRGFDLAHGTTEPEGLRCSYHGWCFGAGGDCLEQPYEDAVRPGSGFRAKVRLRSYPVREKGGLLWTCLAPEPLPLLPDWAGLSGPGCTVIAILHLPCSWVQVMEGFHDPVHVEWLHDRWSYRLNGSDQVPRRPTHVDFRWLEFEHGVVYQRKLRGSRRWLADRTVVFPNVDGAGGQGSYLTWVVPEDDTHFMLVFRHAITSWNVDGRQSLLPPKDLPPGGAVPTYRRSASLEPGRTGAPDLGSWLVPQDVVAWLSPGPIVDRTKERLGESDRGIVMFRNRLFEEAKRVARGEDPQGVLRDPARNVRLTLPGARQNYGLRGEGLPGMTGSDDVMLRAFLPPDVPDEIRSHVAHTLAPILAKLGARASGPAPSPAE